MYPISPECHCVLSAGLETTAGEKKVWGTALTAAIAKQPPISVQYRPSLSVLIMAGDASALL